VHLRVKYTKRSWFESAMLPEDCVESIVQVFGVPSIAEKTLTMFPTTEEFVTFMEEFMPCGSDGDATTCVMTTLSQFESTPPCSA